MIKIRKIFKLEMAHQLTEAYSTCCSECIHGHSYVVEVFLTSAVLLKGMVIDFGELKALLQPWYSKWDHALVMHASAPKEYLDVLQKYNRHLIVLNMNPTAENMAYLFYKEIETVLPNHVSLLSVRVHETDTGYAEHTQNGVNFKG